MPRIKGYESQVSPVGPVGGQRATGASIAPGIAALGDAAENFERMRDQKEVSGLRAGFSTARAQMTIRLDEAARGATPGDSTFSSNFMEGVSTDLDKLGEGLASQSGRMAYQQLRAELEADLTERSYAQQAGLAGRKAAQDVETEIGNYAETLMSDPTQFVTLQKKAREAIDTNPYLSSEKRLEATPWADNTLAQSAIMGMVHNGAGSLAKSELDSGRWDSYLDPKTKAGLLSEAQSAIRGEEVERERVKRAVKEAQEEKQRATMDIFIKRMAPGAEQPLTVPEVVRADLPWQTKEHLYGLIAAAGTREVKTNPHVFNALYQRIRLPDGDPRKIISETEIEEAFVSLTLEYSDLEKLREEFADLRTPDGARLSKTKATFIDNVKASIDKSLLGILDPTGGERLYSFTYAVDEKIREYRAAGKNPHDLFNPSSPDYVGKMVPQYMADVTRPLAAAVRRSSTAGPDAAAPPQPDGSPAPAPAAATKPSRKPGETPAEYKKRVGGG